MDTPAMPVQQQTQPVSHSFDKPIKKTQGFLSFIGKLLLFLVIAAVLILGGYYFGAHNKKTAMVVPPSPTAIPTETPIPSEILPSPTPASQNTKAVKAGLSDTTAFDAYKIDVPVGWTDARETTVAAGLDKLTLTKNGYSITIYQAPMGGGGCLYKDDKPIAMAQEFTDFADIHGKSAQYRRSWNKAAGQAITYTICQKADDESYGVITKFGAISIVSPNPATGAMLSEVDGMIASLIKQ